MKEPGTGLRYQDIANQIRSRIVEGQYRYGDALPSQSNLAKEFSTTVMTVRQAIRRLESDGLVESKHGVGIFVTGLTEDHRAFELASFTQSMEIDRAALGTEIVDRVHAALDPAEADQFSDTFSGVELSSLIRVRTFESIPIVYQVSYVRREYWPIIRDFQPETSLYTTLNARSNTIVTRALEHISARPAPGEVAKYLQFSVGTSCLYSERTSMDAAGRPILFDLAYMASDYIHLSLVRNGRNGDFRFVIDGARERL